MVIYYSHATSDYNTDKETNEYNIIRDLNPKDEIFNPSSIQIPPTENNHFNHVLHKYIYPEIDKCSMLYYSRNANNNLTQGVKAEIEYAYHNKISVLPIIRFMPPNERLKFYERNIELVRGLLDFYNLKDGALRCVVMRPFNRSIKYVYRNPFSNYNYALQSLTKHNFVDIASYARTMQFLPYIFNHKTLTTNRKFDLNNHIIGVSPIVDIDMKDIDPEFKSKGRIDILSDPKYIDEMNNTINTFRDEFNSVDMKIKDIIFTGNGINLMLEDYYDEEIQEIYDVVDGLTGIKQDVQTKTNCELHLKRYGWNSNFKPPFTFHFSNNRLTLLLNPDEDLDIDYLVEYSNPYSEVYNE